ncbi:MAG: class I SAM-dependent methyltransferase [Gammaproteobacteria bacterium]
MPTREENARKVDALRERWFGHDPHPYRILEQRVAAALAPGATLLDAGCGRTAPVLSRFRGRARRLIGIDVIEFAPGVDACELYRRDLAATGLGDDSVDVVYSRSVFEHLDDPAAVLREFRRILRPGGRCLVLTASLWDYATLIARLVPNRFHARIVEQAEGRAREDVFPTRYRCNTRRAVTRHAAGAGLAVDRFDHVGQYPAYFAFSPLLFALAARYERFLRRHRRLQPLLGWILFELVKPASPHVRAHR